MKYKRKHESSTAQFDHPANIRRTLANHGYARISGSEFDYDVETRLAFEALVASFEDLPVDQYDPMGLRQRRYGRFVYTPWTDQLAAVPTVLGLKDQPVTEYFQPVSLNATDGGKPRPFTALHPATASNSALHALIRFDYQALPVPEEWDRLPILVGVHQIKLKPEWKAPAVASPNHLHRDGEPYTFVHLMKRVNVCGSMNFVGLPEVAGFHPKEVDQSAILDKFTLEFPLDSFVVDDRMVSHHVDEAHVVDRAKPAERSAFLIDFTPMLPQFV